MPNIHLPNATVGGVVTRFPPEPSWVLDMGHCKASLMNQHIATQFQGKWILRFDDTNPKTCSQHNVAAYLQDMPLLGLQPDRISHASDYFQPMIDTTTGLIQAGFLYADDTPTEEMRTQRLSKQASPQRDRSMQVNLQAWSQMQSGTEAGQRFCLRFKLEPGSENGALRDPVAWRGIDTPHYKTGTRFRVYPTYDFAAPFLDLAEGVTHALRTLEFRDRDVLYNAVQQAILQLHPEWVASNIWEFPRIHMAYTPQLKVHQKALLAAGLVDGPEDPRLPTLRGLMRAGCHPDALKAFLLDQVSPARKETYHSWDKLWTLNRRLLDPQAARHMAVADTGRVLLTLLDGPTEPRPVEVTWKQGHVVQVVPYKHVWIDQEDAQELCEGDEVTLLAWGNAVIQSITRTSPQQQQQRLEPCEQGLGGDAAVHVIVDQQQHTCAQQQQQQQQPLSCAADKAPVSPQLTKEPGMAESAGQTAAAAAAEEDAASDAAVFQGFTDVLALRDELQQQQQQQRGVRGPEYSPNPWGRPTSSCASTAGSTSVAALASVMSEAGDSSAAPQDVNKQSLQPDDVTPTASQVETPTGFSLQQEPSEQQQATHPHPQQQQLQQQQPGPVINTSSSSSNLNGAEQQHVGGGGQQPSLRVAAVTQFHAVTHMTAVLNLAGSPKASRLKLHWLPALQEQLVPLRLVRFAHPVLVERVTEEVDVVANFNHGSRVEWRAWGDPSLLASAQPGNVVQLQRKGLFIVDQVVLKSGSLIAAAATETAAGGNPSVFSAAAGESLATLSAAPGARVPIGAEAARASRTATQEAAAPAAAAAAAGGAKGELRLCDVDEVVMLYIPDGHTKTEAAIMGRQQQQR